jgi:hypothetical protein
VIAMLAVRTGIAPQTLWDMDPVDLATIVDVLEEQASPGRRRRRG